MNRTDYLYHLPSALIANAPARPRDSSRLMHIDRLSGHIAHHVFRDLPGLLKPSDVLVFNNSAVFPARLHAVKTTGGQVEILLLKKLKNTLWEVISHPGIKPNQTLSFPHGPTAIAVSSHLLSFNLDLNLNSSLLSTIGTTPLPPYIHSSAPESVLRRQYQTVYAKSIGSAAAPTAGLHFTPRLLRRLAAAGIQTEYLTLHVGLGTFQPPSPQQITAGKLHSEWFTLSPAVAARLNRAKAAGRRIIAVGTTTCRVLESCTDSTSHLHPRTGDTDIFIKPSYQFKFIDGLLTNFHLPGSSLLMLVSAFSSPEIIRRAYTAAIRHHYRFFSFGDACLFT